MKYCIDRCLSHEGVVTIDGWCERGPPSAVFYAGKEMTSKSFGIERPDVANVHGTPAAKWGFRTSAIISTGPIDETKIILRFGGVEAPILIYGVPLDEQRVLFPRPSDALFDKAGQLRSSLPLGVGWFHSVPFGSGRYTKGHKRLDQMNREARTWRFPSDLTGKTMLDIGCADGGWSVHGLLRGAASVTSIDSQQTQGRRFLQDNKIFPINFMTVDLYSDEFMKLEPADFVLFAGVLYHVHEPLEALKRLRRKTKGFAILETQLDERFGNSVPYTVFYENDELAGDPSNWFGPNRMCLEAWLRVAGFRFTLSDIYFSSTIGRITYMLYPNT
jgi:tRNA (mo5U34)-methyltransferase